MSRYSPTVLPRYFGGDPGSEIADALDRYVQGKRQERFDDLAATKGEIDLYESGYRPSAGDVEPVEASAPAPIAATEPDEAAAALDRMRQGPATIGDVDPTMLFRHGPTGDQQRGGAMPMPAQDPRTPPAPGAGALAQQMGRRYFELAGGGVYVPGASKQERMVQDERGYRDRVRGEENQLTDRRIQDDRGYRDRQIQDERGYRDRVRGEENQLADVRRSTDRNFEVTDREDRQAHDLSAAERAAQLRIDVERAQNGGGASGAGAPGGARWEERRKAAIRVLGEPTTPLRQDIADALADGATPQQILEKLRQVAPAAVQAAEDYLMAGEQQYEGAQTPRRR